MSLRVPRGKVSTMSHEPTPLTTSRGARPVPGVPEFADHWGLVFGYGVVSLALGIILAVWPGETLKVCAVIVAIQFVVSGVMRVVVALTSRHLDGGIRALVGFSGALAVIVGLLCLRDPLETLLVIGLLVGVWLLLAGFVDLLSAFLSPVPGRRIWDVATGLVSVVAGGFLVVNPHVSLGLLVVVACVWLIGIGLFAVLAGLRMRKLRSRGHTHRAGGAAASASR
jgi:uncharacterized membrane protein HdeD (DUF308 family)